MHRARKEAILEECTRLLSELGYDAMTLDQVAEAAGMAKAVLYKHFKGKDDLCCEVMVRSIARTNTLLDGFPECMQAIERLQAFVRWVLQGQLGSEGPLAADRKSEIRHALKASEAYQNARYELGVRLEELIVQSQSEGHIHTDWPVLVVRQILMSRSADPIVDALLVTERFTHEEIVEWGIKACMASLRVSPHAVNVVPSTRAVKKKTSVSNS